MSLEADVGRLAAYLARRDARPGLARLQARLILRRMRLGIYRATNH